MRHFVYAAVLGLLAANVQASPVKWYVDVYFQGPRAVGSFVYDDETNIYSDVLIDVFAGTFSRTYTEALLSPGSPHVFSPRATAFGTDANQDVGDPILVMFFATPGLATTAREVQPSNAFVGTCNTAAEGPGISCGSVTSYSDFDFGVLTGVDLPDPVPAPAAAWLVAPALAAVVPRLKRRKGR